MDAHFSGRSPPCVGSSLRMRWSSQFGPLRWILHVTPGCSFHKMVEHMQSSIYAHERRQAGVFPGGHAMTTTDMVGHITFSGLLISPRPLHEVTFPISRLIILIFLRLVNLLHHFQTIAWPPVTDPSYWCHPGPSHRNGSLGTSTVLAKH